MTEILTARRLDQDTAAAKRAAEDEPVRVTDRGRPSNARLTFDANPRLIGAGDRVARPAAWLHVPEPAPEPHPGPDSALGAHDVGNAARASARL